jgi:hypothetical protein
MHGHLPSSPPSAISSTPGTGIELVPEAGANPGTGTDDWFYDCAIAVFGKEAGQQLHLATDWPRTSCYAFVARDPAQRRKLHPDFLRILFQSEHGQPFHDAFMAGCTASWWLDRERDERLAAASKRFIAEITKPE